MIKKVFLFTMLSVFTFVVSTPDLVLLLDKEMHAKVLLDSTDEEKKESETSKEKEVKIIEMIDASLFHANMLQKNRSLFDEKKYASVYLNLVLPPPDFS